MFSRNRTLALAAALAAALVMLVGVAGVALADSQPPAAAATVCVDGYVINHRELAVNGTKFDPQLAVAVTGPGGMSFADVDKNGYFKFEKLPAGEWEFTLDLPPDWEGIVPVAERSGIASTGSATLTEQKGCYQIVFKIRRVFDVAVIKWEELLDGSVRAGEGWAITAKPVNDPFVKAQSGETDEYGIASMTLTAGRWVISEKVKAGWTPITPSQVTIDLDQYAKARQIGEPVPVVFKNREPACKSVIEVEKVGIGTDAEGGDVWLGPLAGWQVTVSRADGAMTPITKVTDGSGKASFEGLLPGVYKVTEHVQVGWEAISENPQTVIHRDCETTPVMFENRETKGDLRIYGTKWFKAWTPPYKGQLVGLSGWVITATLVGTDYSVTTETNALGQYLFTEAGLGELAFPGASIDVCEEDRDNWIHVTPKCVRVKFPYPVPPDYAGVKVDFTNVQDPPLTDASNGSTCRATHTVARGETLARIAVRYNTSVWAIAKANKIRNIDFIVAGQQLCIP